MPTFIEINGIDESGSIGEPIIFCRITVSIKNEVQLFLRNLNHFGTLMPNKMKLRGFDPSYLLKYVTGIIDDPTLKIELYQMQPDVQLKLVNCLAMETASELQMNRTELVNIFDPQGNLKNTSSPASVVYKTTDILKRFKNPKIWVESFVKSYGMMCMTKELGISLKQKQKNVGEDGFSDYFSVQQIAGGYPFAFWWKELMEGGHFEKGSFIVNGISNGDEHYPSMSCAGTVANALLKNQDKLHLFPIKPIELDNTVDLNNFYSGHSRALETPIFQKRMIFVGKMDENLRMCIPYLEHLRDLHYTPEATSIIVPIDWFFKARGYGNPDNTTIIHSSMLSSQDKINLEFCKKKAYPVVHVCNYKEDFQKLVSSIQSEASFAPTQRRSKLSSALSQIEEICLKNME